MTLLYQNLVISSKTRLTPGIGDIGPVSEVVIIIFEGTNNIGPTTPSALWKFGWCRIWPLVVEIAI